MIASDGHTHERRAVGDLFKREEEKEGKRTSPKTRKNIPGTKLIPIHDKN